MISEGRGYGVALALQSLLRKLEAKGVLSHSEVVTMLDSICEEIDELQRRQVLAPDAAADAVRTVGLLYLPSSATPATIPLKDLSAEND